MNDDLIKRLRRCFNGLEGLQTDQGDYGVLAEAAAALSEAQATIARQQVMLDRALEDAGDKMVEIGRLREALQEIIDASNNTGIEMGTVGMRVAERVEDIARAALEAKHG